MNKKVIYLLISIIIILIIFSSIVSYILYKQTEDILWTKTFHAIILEIEQKDNETILYVECIENDVTWSSQYKLHVNNKTVLIGNRKVYNDIEIRTDLNDISDLKVGDIIVVTYSDKIESLKIPTPLFNIKKIKLFDINWEAIDKYGIK